MSFIAFVKPVEFIGAHPLLPLLFYEPKASTFLANLKPLRRFGQFAVSLAKGTEGHFVFFWIKSLVHINLFTSSPFGGSSPDPLSSIADSPE